MTYTLVYVGSEIKKADENRIEIPLPMSAAETGEAGKAAPNNKAGYWIGGGAAALLLGSGAFLLIRSRRRRYADGAEYENISDLEET